MCRDFKSQNRGMFIDEQFTFNRNKSKVLFSHCTENSSIFDMP